MRHQRRIAFEEAFRVKGESYSRSRGTYTSSNVTEADTPRVFSRQMARFQILDSESLRGVYNVYQMPWDLANTNKFPSRINGVGVPQ